MQQHPPSSRSESYGASGWSVSNPVAEAATLRLSDSLYGGRPRLLLTALKAWRIAQNVPLASFAHFLGAWSGVTARDERGAHAHAAAAEEGTLLAAIECLQGFPMYPADLESAILPARVAPYLPAQIAWQRDPVVQRMRLGGDHRDVAFGIVLAQLLSAGLARDAVAEDHVAAGHSFRA